MIVILDTNVVLDLLLFADLRTTRLRERLEAKTLRWHTTQHMRNELARVLAYDHISELMTQRCKTAVAILQSFDQFAVMVSAPAQRAPYACKDADDQPFIDLACALASAHPAAQVQLVSKDKAVLSMRKRLRKLSVFVNVTILD